MQFLMSFKEKITCNYECVLLVCPSGTWNDNCSQPCPHPTFGTRCLQTCSCDENMCDAVTGCNDSSEFCKIVYTCTNDTIYNSVVVNNNDFFSFSDNTQFPVNKECSLQKCTNDRYVKSLCVFFKM